MTLLLGTDIGTLGAKSVLVDVEGRVLAAAFKEYGVLTPRQGWAEQWPGIWVEAAFETIGQCLEEARVNPRDVEGVCVSSLYGGSGIPCDEEMKPLRPCIIWADRRAVEECRWVEESIDLETLFQITGNVIDPYYGYVKMLWIKRHEPETWRRIQRLMTPNGYCIYSMTDVESVDLSSAGNYGGIFNIERRTWSEEMMELLGIPRELFPEHLYKSDEVVGEVTLEASRRTGLKPGTPVCAGGIDAPMSALAVGALEDGDVAVMLGTSMCNGFISHTPRLSPKLVNFPYVIEGERWLYSFAGVTTAGYCIRWFRDQLGRLEALLAPEIGEDAYVLLDREAEVIPLGSEGLLFLPHMMVGERAPYWDEHLRGALLGLTVYHTKAHLFRAFLEGVAYAARYSLEVAKEAGHPLRRVMLVDGGARSRLWRQILSDVTGLRMLYLPETIGAPLGDALLAGIAVGAFEGPGTIRNWLGEGLWVEPNRERVRIYECYYQLYRRSLKACGVVFEGITRLT